MTDAAGPHLPLALLSQANNQWGSVHALAPQSSNTGSVVSKGCLQEPST